MPLGADIIGVEQLTVEDRSNWCAWHKAAEWKSPFLSLGFTLAVARAGQGVRIARLTEDDAVVGYFPFQTRGSTAYPVGAPMNDYHAVIGPRDRPVVLQDLQPLLPVRRVSVNSWLGQSSVGLDLTTCQTVLPDSYEVWFDQQRKTYNKFFKDKARGRRGMETTLGTMSVETGLKDHALLDRLIALKSDQYRRTGRHDIFGAGWTRDLLHILMDGTGECSASMAVLKAGDEILALELSLCGDGVWHFWFPAYLDIGAKYSPGIWLSLETMRIESQHGFSVFDFGFSGEAYKKYLCNQTTGVTEAVVGGRDWIAGLEGVVGKGSVALSIRRRWAAIDAAEITWNGRTRGIVLAGLGRIKRMGRGESRK